MVKLEKVKKHYKGFELDCSLEVPAGCVTGLIGKNGAGKSTTFKILLGLVERDGGKVEIFGRDLKSLPAKEKEHIGVVLADAGFSGYLTIQDLLPMLEQMYAGFQREEFQKICRQFELPMNIKIKEFSTGMKQKLQVLAAISHRAKLLILDEPTVGMDVVARDELMDLLRAYMETEGRSILISSHISGDLERFCDDLYMIDDGKVILHEETDVLLNNYALLKMTDEQYQKLDTRFLLRYKRESFGFSCLTDQKQYYTDNYPQLTVERGSIDEVITMMVRGNKL